jgi:hypothetical protein
VPNQNPLSRQIFQLLEAAAQRLNPAATFQEPRRDSKICDLEYTVSIDPISRINS